MEILACQNNVNLMLQINKTESSAKNQLNMRKQKTGQHSIKINQDMEKNPEQLTPLFSRHQIRICY